MIKKTYSIEASSQFNLLKLPNFHILAYRKEDGVMTGHCLDFGIWAYSEQKDDEIALKNVFKRLSEMVLMHILGHLRRDTIDHLYDNKSEGLNGEWKAFSQNNDIKKIKDLKESYDAIISNPTIIEQKIKEETLKKLLEKLTSKAMSDFFKIIDKLQNLKPEESEVIIEEMLSLLSLVPGYKLKLAS